MRRVGLAVLVMLLGLGGALVRPAAAAGAAEGDGSDVSVTRYGGADRYETSLLIAEAVVAEAGGSLPSVVLVSGERWTDAVVAAPVAGVLGAAVLMTPPGELRADARAFLERVGVSTAVVIGPDASGGEHGPGRGVRSEVFEALEDAGISAERVAGDDRFGTGVAAAGRIDAGDMGELGRTAIVASADVFADALVAGPFAARGNHPVLLTSSDELHAEVAGYLSAEGISHVVLMGGTAALSDTVESSLTDLGVSVTRLAGTTRYDTAVKAAELVTDRYSDAAGQPCFAAGTIGLARARVPFDSLGAAPLLSRLCAPLVLADPGQIPPDTAAYIDTARDANPTVDLRVFGGNAAVSEAAIGAYLSGTEDEDEAASESDESEDAEPVGPAAAACGGAAGDEPRPLTMSNIAEDPAWSPDCSRIVFSRAGSLWTMSNDGTDQQQLVDDDIAYSDEPAWSPDGTQIAYNRGQRNDDGHWFSHIYVINADGTGRTKVSKGDVRDRQPAWSPDGTQIAFERLSGSGRDDEGRFIDPDRYIAVMTPIGAKPVILTEGGRWDRSPRWSPDGSRIAYISGGAVKVMSPDGTGERTVVTDVHYRSGLSWSPDGRMLAFARSDGESRRHLVAVEVDGPDKYRLVEHQITDLSGWVADPRWSPDGQLIAFTHYDQDGANIEIYGDRDVAIVGIGWLGVTTTAPLKVQAIYAVPHGGASTAGREKAIADSVAAAQQWFRSQTGGRHPVFERDDAGVSVETVRLPEIDLTDGFDSGRALRDALDYHDATPLLIIVEGEITGNSACGWRSDNYMIIPIDNCDIEPRENAQWPAGMSYIIGHELTHLLGAAPSCAPNSDGGSHVLDDNRDVIWAGNSPRDWDNLMLDVNRDDYFEHGRADCPDISDHYLLGTE